MHKEDVLLKIHKVLFKCSEFTSRFISMLITIYTQKSCIERARTYKVSNYGSSTKCRYTIRQCQNTLVVCMHYIKREFSVKCAICPLNVFGVLTLQYNKTEKHERWRILNFIALRITNAS